MEHETVALVAMVVIASIVFFVLPFIALVRLGKKRMRAYEETAGLQLKQPSKGKQAANTLETDYTWRKWKIVYIVAAFLVAAGVFINAWLPAIVFIP